MRAGLPRRLHPREPATRGKPRNPVAEVSAAAGAYGQLIFKYFWPLALVYKALVAIKTEAFSLVPVPFFDKGAAVQWRPG